MRVTIDAAGRVVVPKAVPKAVREQLHLDAGTPLDLCVRDGRLELEPVPIPMRLVRHGQGVVGITDEPVKSVGVDEGAARPAHALLETYAGLRPAHRDDGEAGRCRAHLS